MNNNDEIKAVSHQKKNSLQELNVRSAEVQEIIGRPPPGLVRWGIAGLLGVLILILLTASVIKYPETITAHLRLTAINAPKVLQSKINGKLIKILIKNNTYVKRGQILGWMKSTANHKEVLSLSMKVDSMHKWLENGNLKKFETVKLSNFSDLGNLQKSFQAFEQSYRQFMSYLPGAYYDKKKEMLKHEITYNHSLLNKLKVKKNLQKQQYQLAHQEYMMKEKLHEKQLIAPLKFIKQHGQLLSNKLPLQQTKSAIINNHLAQVAKREQLIDLKHKVDQQKSLFLQSLNMLQSAIVEWKDKYLLVAPFDGKLIYAGIIQKNQSFKTGQHVFYIKPNNTRFFGEILISQHSLGKIQKGQKVLVRFSGYPYREFGSVPGRISYISGIPINDSSYVAKVHFPKGLTTDYGNKIHPEDGMRGQARIITKDRRLLERLYDNIAGQMNH
jgi:HlyD family secretion protein